MSNTKAVVFDLDNTLFDEADYFFQVVVAFCERNNIDIKKDDFFSFFKRTRNKTINIINDILQFLSLDVSEERRDELFELLKSIDIKLSLFEDAELFIDYLRNKEIKLGLLTNGVVDIQRNKVKCLEIESIFDKIVYARKWGADYEKPNQKSFIYIVDKLGVEFRDCIFIGDNPKIDFQVPCQYGSTTMRLLRGTYENMDTNLKIDYIIKNYGDLIK